MLQITVLPISSNHIHRFVTVASLLYLGSSRTLLLNIAPAISFRCLSVRKLIKATYSSSGTNRLQMIWWRANYGDKCKVIHLFGETTQLFGRVSIWEPHLGSWIPSKIVRVAKPVIGKSLRPGPKPDTDYIIQWNEVNVKMTTPYRKDKSTCIIF